PRKLVAGELGAVAEVDFLPFHFVGNVEGNFPATELDLLKGGFLAQHADVTAGQPVALLLQPDRRLKFGAGLEFQVNFPQSREGRLVFLAVAFEIETPVLAEDDEGYLSLDGVPGHLALVSEVDFLALALKGDPEGQFAVLPLSVLDGDGLPLLGGQGADVFVADLFQLEDRDGGRAAGPVEPDLPRTGRVLGWLSPQGGRESSEQQADHGDRQPGLKRVLHSRT